MKQFGWKHLIWALVVGLAAGVALGLHMPRHRPPWGRPAGGQTARMVDRFSRDLKLTVEQRTKLTAILERTHKRIAALRNEAGPKFEAIRKETSGAIEKILTPEQVPLFREHEKKWDAHHRGPGAGPGCGPGQEAPAR